jgi:hypothetical protein
MGITRKMEEMKMNENEGRMNGKEATDSAKALAKWIAEEAKKNKELLGLVCHMRLLLDKCTYGNGDQIDFDHKKLVRANDLMMMVQHEKDLAKEAKAQARTPMANGGQPNGGW